MEPDTKRNELYDIEAQRDDGRAKHPSISRRRRRSMSSKYAAPGEVWIDTDGATLIILEEDKALVVESFTVIEKEDYELMVRREDLEKTLSGIFNVMVSEQKRYH
jgi:hypothetical protein